MFLSPIQKLPSLVPRIVVSCRPAASRALISSQQYAAPFRSFSSSKMTDSTNNPDGKKVPKPSEAPQEGHKPVPDTGWKGEVPSHKGGNYEKDFLNKPPYKWTSDKFQSKYKA